MRIAKAVGKPSGLALSGFKEPGARADKYALSMTADGKFIFLLATFEVEQGATDAGDPIPISYKDGNYIVANRAKGLDVISIILDVRTLKAVISYTGQGMLGIKGRSILASCK